MSLEVEKAKEWAEDKPRVQAVYEGFKYVNGKRTTEKAIVVAVDEKLPLSKLSPEDVVPPRFGNLPTDVIEGTFNALALTQRKRPCPAGFSIGHVGVTAGTFGLPVRRGIGDSWLILTNNHVAANSNNAALGDRILQPGKHDSGSDPNDWWATLVEYVTITFEGQQPPKKFRAVGALWWSLIRGTGNLGAMLARCPMRVRIGPLAIDQPSPNLVDAALCAPRSPELIEPIVHTIGPVLGSRDLQLGEAVVKVGRTTEKTTGFVEGVNGSVRVNFGEQGVAAFDDQIFIRSDGSGDFSAGGDSGSAILTKDHYVGALLFAGGGGLTVGNKFSNVQALLGVRV